MWDVFQKFLVSVPDFFFCPSELSEVCGVVASTVHLQRERENKDQTSINVIRYNIISVLKIVI